MIAHSRAAVVTIVIGLGTGFGSGTANGVRIEPLSTPAAEASLTGNLSALGDVVYLSWLEQRADGHALMVASLDGDAFGPPETIRTSAAFFANWADFASTLPLPSGRLVAQWLETSAASPYAYDVWIATSTDRGRTWEPAARPHRDGTPREHGFVSMVSDGDDGFTAVWLDGRAFRDGAPDNEMRLMSTTFEGGRFHAEQPLDTRVCECCQTGMARTSDGLVAVYRDRSPDEVRDIGLVRFVDGAWTAPRILNRDGWTINGCPVNGPQVAAADERVAVAWFTAAGADAKVQLVTSTDGSERFGQPMRIDSGRPVGRVDVEMLGEDIVVSWLERGDDERAEVRLQRISAAGTVVASATVARTGAARASGFPRLAVRGSDVFVTWTDTYAGDRPSRVRVAKATFE